MRIVFIRTPSSLGLIGNHSCQHPIGLAYLASVARGEGRDVQIWDYEVEPFRPEAFQRRVRDFAPDFMGITAMTPLIGRASAMAALAREVAPACAIAVGGAHPSAAPEDTLARCPAFDAAFVGEGERSLARALAAISSGEGFESAAAAGGGIFVRGAEAGAPPAGRRLTGDELLNMDDLPFPSRDLIPLHLYRGAATPGIPNRGGSVTQLFTSRGCFALCTFCSSEKVFTRKVRMRSAENVLAEARECAERWGFSHFTIDDDIFTLNRKRTRELCEGFHALNITWDCDCRVDMVDDEILKLMAWSGCKKIAFGVESGSQRILDLIEKNITVEKIERAFRLSREAGIMTCAFLMVGNHADEKPEDIAATERLVERIRPDLIDVTIATPLPNTELYRQFREEGLIDDADWSRFKFFFGRPPWRTRHFSSAELVRLQRRLLKAFYLRPGYLARRLSKIRTMADARYWFSAGAEFLRVLFGRRTDPAGLES